jgi:hypothetical protein
MKTRKALLVSVLAVLFLGWGITPAVLAQEDEAALALQPQLLVAGTVNVPATATDVYHVHCGARSVRLEARVTDSAVADGDNISMVAHDVGGVPAASITAPDGGTSALITVTGGVGAYLVAIFKSSPPFVGAENYKLDVQCRDANGGATGTAAVLVQNQ